MRRCGVTLVELLVTTGITAVLIAVSSPVLSRARHQTRALSCASNIRQQSLALFVYAADNGKFPYGFYSSSTMSAPEGGYAGYNQYNRRGWWWFNYLEGLYKKNMGERTVLQCPSKNLRDIKLDGDILCGNYGVNLSICKMSWGMADEKFIGEPLTSAEVARPSQTLLLLDSGYAIISWWHAADEPPMLLGNTTIEQTTYVPGLKINKDRLFWPGGGQDNDALNGRHPNKTINIGFLDGHVSRNSADDVLVEKSSDRYKNLVPLWGPK